MINEPPSWPIKRQSVPEAVADSLRSRILNGEFEGGQQLRQEAIANDYAVSRMPVREALRQLEAEGLVRLQTHKGAIVTALSAQELNELFDIRSILETDLLTRAMPNQTAEALAEAEAINASLNEAYEGGYADSWGRLNWAFHHALYAPAERPQTMALVHTINTQTERYMRVQLGLDGEIERSRKDHDQLLRLYRAGDQAAAVAFLREHIIAARDALMIVMRNGLPRRGVV